MHPVGQTIRGGSLTGRMLLRRLGLVRSGGCLAAARSFVAANYGANPHADNSAIYRDQRACFSQWSHAHGKGGHLRGTPVSALPESTSGPAAAIILQQMGMQLPERCCGCGIRLQMTSPEAPGYFIVPQKLLDFAVRMNILPERRGDVA